MGARRLVVEADGGSRGNPGNAGYGALVRDGVTGEVIAERAESVGIASNNVAEYSGLVAGLQAAYDIDHGAEVSVRLDSKLLVEQMSGRWKIRQHDMRRLALQAQQVVADITAAGGSVGYTWVPRAENSAADALANSAMDGKPVNWTGTPDADVATDADSEVGPDHRVEVGTERDSGVGSDRRPEVGRPGDRAEVGPGLRAGGGAGPAAVDRPDLAFSRKVGVTGAAAWPPDVGTPTRVVLVRHGVTNFTNASKLDGRGGPDPSLNAEGRRQAKAAAAGVRAFLGDRSASVITSSLQRAIQTGAAIADMLGVPAQIDADWDEQNFGDWDGRSIGYLVARQPEALQQFRDDPLYSRPGGESHVDLEARVVAAFERATAVGETVVVASHRKPIMTVLAHVLGIPHDRIWRLATAPASLTFIEVWADGGTSVAFVNDTSHLR